MIHEVLGLAMALGFWTACYALQPSRTFMRPVASALARNQRLEQAYSMAMVRAQRSVQSWSWLRSVPGISRWGSRGRSLYCSSAKYISLCASVACASCRDPARLTVSLAESITLRACIKPLTFPFKIWASYRLVLAAKARQHGQMAAMHLSRAHQSMVNSMQRQHNVTGAA